MNILILKNEPEVERVKFFFILYQGKVSWQYIPSITVSIQ